MGAPHRGWYIAFTLPRIRRMARSPTNPSVEPQTTPTNENEPCPTEHHRCDNDRDP